MNTITITESVNYFGDSVYSFRGREYNFYQHNCSQGKELVKAIKSLSAIVLLIYVEQFNDGLHIILKPALPILEEMLKTDEYVAQFARCNNSPGAEIAGKYGY